MLGGKNYENFPIFKSIDKEWKNICVEKLVVFVSQEGRYEEGDFLVWLWRKEAPHVFISVQILLRTRNLINGGGGKPAKEKAWSSALINLIFWYRIDESLRHMSLRTLC